MSETVIQRGKPLPRPQIIETLNGVDLAPESGKELPRRVVPVPVISGPLLPAREVLQNPRVFRVVKRVVPNSRRNESALVFLPLLSGNDELQPIPGMTNPDGIGRGIKLTHLNRCGSMALTRSMWTGLQGSTGSCCERLKSHWMASSETLPFTNRMTSLLRRRGGGGRPFLTADGCCGLHLTCSSRGRKSRVEFRSVRQTS